MSNIIEISIHSRVYGTHIAKVDFEDYPIISNFKWYLRRYKDQLYYATNRKTRMHMHRMILGDQCIGKLVDHIDNDGLNNCRNNLRPVTHAQNMYNSRSRKNSTSKFKGVHWNKSKKRWTCQIKGLGSKTKHIGHFKSELDAAIAYNNEAIKIHGEYAKLNVMPLPTSI